MRKCVPSASRISGWGKFVGAGGMAGMGDGRLLCAGFVRCAGFSFLGGGVLSVQRDITCIFNVDYFEIERILEIMYVVHWKWKMENWFMVMVGWEVLESIDPTPPREY
jgi:hypothetical protein